MGCSFVKIKEWAYAGLLFDTLGALYSHLSIGDGIDKYALAMVGLLLVISTYILYSIKQRHSGVL